jgi:hypothetical protein
MSDLSSAKQRLLDTIGRESWCTGIGIGLVGNERRKGLIVSLAEDAPDSARPLIESLHLDVPVDVRVLHDVRKRGQ